MKRADQFGEREVLKWKMSFSCFEVTSTGINCRNQSLKLCWVEMKVKEKFDEKISSKYLVPNEKNKYTCISKTELI